MHPHPVTRLGRTTARLILGMLAIAAVACGAGLPGDPKARAAEIVRAAGASGRLGFPPQAARAALAELPEDCDTRQIQAVLDRR